MMRAEYRDRKPGDPIEGIPPLSFDESGSNQGPAIMWINPWSGQPEAVFSFWWPVHPPEETEAVEHLYERLGNLFAAAPVMLAALERMLSDLREEIETGLTSRSLSEKRADLRAAIAKAKA